MSMPTQEFEALRHFKNFAQTSFAQSTIWGAPLEFCRCTQSHILCKLDSLVSNNIRNCIKSV